MTDPDFASEVLNQLLDKDVSGSELEMLEAAKDRNEFAHSGFLILCRRNAEDLTWLCSSLPVLEAAWQKKLEAALGNCESPRDAGEIQQVIRGLDRGPDGTSLSDGKQAAADGFRWFANAGSLRACRKAAVRLQIEALHCDCKEDIIEALVEIDEWVNDLYVSLADPVSGAKIPHVDEPAKDRTITVDGILKAIRDAKANVGSRSAVQGWTRQHDFPGSVSNGRLKVYPFDDVAKWLLQNRGICIDGRELGDAS